MANYLQFSFADFVHLSPKQAHRVKKLVYRKDFQESVLKLRKKHKIQKFPTRKVEDLKRHPTKGVPMAIHMEDDYDKHNRGDDFDSDFFSEFGHMPHYPFIKWQLFIRVLLFTNKILEPPRFEPTEFELTDDKIQQIKEQYLQADEYMQEGDLDKAEAELQNAETTIYISEQCTVRTNKGNIHIKLTPKFSGMAHLQPAMNDIKKFLKAMKPIDFGKGKNEMLDILNDIAVCEQEGMDTKQTITCLRERYRDEGVAQGINSEHAFQKACAKISGSEDTIRVMRKRAKDLGF